MVSVDTTATAVDGVTLVTVRVAGDGIARRVRVEQRLDGPVWPPRREGQPAPGWDDAGYEGVVPPDGRLVLGYATPAPPAPEPVSVEEGQTVAEDDCGDDLDDASGVLQRLGDPAPPRDAVALSETDDSATAPDSGADETGTDLEAGEAVSGTADADPATSPHGTSTPVDPVSGWLDRVEERLATVERLDTVETVPEATAVLRSTGGLPESRRAVRASRADRRRLLAVAARARRLADRIEATDPRLAALELFR